MYAHLHKCIFICILARMKSLVKKAKKVIHLDFRSNYSPLLLILEREAVFRIPGVHCENSNSTVGISSFPGKVYPQTVKGLVFRFL